MQWQEPLEIYKKVAANYSEFAFLHSGVRTSYTGRYSYLAFGESSQKNIADFRDLEALFGLQKYYGFLPYELKNSIEDYSEAHPSYISVKHGIFKSFTKEIIFDHDTKSIRLSNVSEDEIEKLSGSILNQGIQTKNLNSNFTKDEYIKAVEHIRAEIKKGNVYQANLTRKFWGEFETKIDSTNCFLELAAISKVPYSAHLKFKEIEIVSMSPELFLRLEEGGKLVTRPIKGSCKTSADSIENEHLISQILLNEKNKAENLMIADLMRNDLAKSAVNNSVKVDEYFSVDKYPTINHLSTQILAQISPDVSPASAIKNAFPAGSMTGAPKIAAVEICNSLEKQARGIYSGALGWVEGGQFELDVVIRTLVLQGKKFEFQVGGGVTWDSSSEDEYQESLTKAKAIAKVLGLELE